jgi:hypothetical protein
LKPAGRRSVSHLVVTPDRWSVQCPGLGLAALEVLAALAAP